MTERAQSWRNALYAGIFFGAAFGLFNAGMNGWLTSSSAGDAVAAVVSGLAAGGVFGLLLGLFMQSPIVPSPEDVPLRPGETIEYSGLANHFLNFEGRGGRLTLTRDRLIFTPHAVNLQVSDLAIPRGEIAGVAPVRTLGIVPNGIAVTLKSGDIERFAVNGRNQWMAKIAGH